MMSMNPSVMMNPNVRAFTATPLPMPTPAPVPVPTAAPPFLVPLQGAALTCQPQAQVSMAPSLAGFAPTNAWRSNLFTDQELARTGQLATGPDIWTTLASGLGLVGTALGAYHGYKRTGSVGWTIAWALLGGLFPIITIPVAFAQGFGKPSAGFPASGASGNLRPVRQR